MAVNRDPILKRCRSLDIDPSHVGIFKESKRTSTRRQRKMSEFKFDDKGLLPVVVQDHISGEVLMVAWANEEAIEKMKETA